MEDLEKFLRHCSALLLLDRLQSERGGADFLAAGLLLSHSEETGLSVKISHAGGSFYCICAISVK